MKGRTWRIRLKNKDKRSNFLDSCLITQHKCLGQWLKENGMKKHHLYPRNFTETGRGLMASCKINPGDVIISIPQNLLITIDTVINSELGPALYHSKLTLQQALAVFLLIEKHKQQHSKWWNYIKTIPKKFSTPAYFTPEECSMLPERLKNNAHLHITKIRKSYINVQTFCKNFEINDKLSLTFASFKWAWYAVNSRSVYYESKCCHFEENGNMALAPYLDLLNHSLEAKSEAKFNLQNKCYEIKTWNTYKKYDQVFISYGPHDNHKLFLEYGFILPNNPHSVYEIAQEQILDLALFHNIEHFEQKWKILLENDLLKGLSCSLDGVSWKLEIAAKILVMNWNELQGWKQIMLGTVTSCEIDMSARNLIKILLNGEFAKLLSKSQSQRPPENYHEEMCKSLLQEDSAILQTSIKLC